MLSLVVSSFPIFLGDVPGAFSLARGQKRFGLQVSLGVVVVHGAQDGLPEVGLRPGVGAASAPALPASSCATRPSAGDGRVVRLSRLLMGRFITVRGCGARTELSVLLVERSRQLVELSTLLIRESQLFPVHKHGGYR